MLGSLTQRSRIQRFVVTGQLGSGTMGTVYRARDPALERDVAIKVLTRPATEVCDALLPHDTIDLRGEEHGGDDLLSEARMMARLSHPNVLPVYEVGLADGEVFLVMEHVDGTNLRTWLATPRRTREILEMFAQAARGLKAAHDRGIVHGDFKPENVLVGDGRVRVADFGLSRLSSVTSLLQFERAVGGTPYYMAPELWRGAPATAQSDVFALCTAIAEALGAEPSRRDSLPRALRERGCDRRLQRALLAGLAEDPGARVSLDAVVSAIEPRRLRRRHLGVAAAALGGVAVALVAAAVMTSADEPACTADAVQFAGRWDDARRAALAAIDLADDVDRARSELEAARVALCTAERRGQVTAEQARIRASCLERRGIGIDAMARTVGARGAKEAAEDALGALTSVADCETVVAPPLAGDRAPIAAVHARMASAYAGTFGSEERAREFAAVEADARALGELDLAASAALSLGKRQIESDDLRAADESLGRAYRDGVAIHNNTTVLVALVKRAIAAVRHSEVSSARSYGQLALELAERPGVSADRKVYVYLGLGEVELENDPERALALGEKALVLLREGRLDDPFSERTAQQIMIEALGQLRGGREVRALALAREHLELSRKTLGEDHPDFGISINIVALALRRNADIAGALVYRRQALEALARTLPADHSTVITQRAIVASDLMALGQFAAACDEFAVALAAAGDNDAMRSQRARWRADRGLCEFERGRAEDGKRMYDLGVEEIVALFGPAYIDSLSYRLAQIELEIELGEIATASKHAEALERDYRRSGISQLQLATLEGVHRARIANARGQSAEAERRTRAGLAAWSELRGDENGRRRLLRVLAESLVAQRRWRDAQVALDMAAAIKSTDRADELAKGDVVRARVLAGLGQRREAQALARKVRAVLEQFPGARMARADAAALLAARR